MALFAAVVVPSHRPARPPHGPTWRERCRVACYRHLALYLRAKTTLRERRIADARNQRIGAFVRSVVTIVVVGPFRLLRSLLSTGSDVAVEMLPPARRDPAKARVSTLTRDPEFAKAAERFTATADGATPIAGQHEESRGAKAA